MIFETERLVLRPCKVHNTGSAQPQTTVPSLEKYKLFMPSSEKAEEFSKHIMPLRDAMRKYEDGNLCMTELRYSLLPKLMSRESDASDWEI